MIEADAIRAAFPRHAPKRLALLMGVPCGTAGEWLKRRFPARRRIELARRLLDEFDRQDRERAEIRRQLREIAGSERAEAGSGVAGGTADEDRRRDHLARPQARAVGQ